MKIFSILKNNKSYCRYLLCIFATVLILFNSGCESLPSHSEGPDNPLDPSNPNNNIKGPALVLSPVKLDVKSQSQFELELWIVETDPIAGISTNILFDPVKFRVEEVDSLITGSESFLLGNGGRLIFISTFSNDTGYIKIDCAIVEGEPRDVEGGGIISRITFSHLSESTASISLSSDSYLRNSQNEAVIINDLLNSDIIIKN